MATAPSAPAPASTMVDHVRAALATIEEAQSLVRFGCCELSNVPHFDDDYERLCRLEETIHAEWRRLSSALVAKRSRLQ
jgi:hypothetical protein